MSNNELNYNDLDTTAPEDIPSKSMRQMVVLNVVNPENSLNDVQETLSSIWFELQGHYGKVKSLKGNIIEEENDFEIIIEFESIFLLSRKRGTENHTTKITSDESTWGLYGDITDDQREEYRGRLQEFSQFLEVSDNDSKEINNSEAI